MTSINSMKITTVAFPKSMMQSPTVSGLPV